MSEYCNLSENHFRTLFKKRTGMSPKIYIDKLKNQKAKDLLITTNDNIAEIANQLGYLDPFHFSRRFKELTGYAPDHYRKIKVRD